MKDCEDCNFGRDGEREGEEGSVGEGQGEVELSVGARGEKGMGEEVNDLSLP